MFEDGQTNLKRKQGLSDDAWDSIAAVSIIAIIVAGLVWWLS